MILSKEDFNDICINLIADSAERDYPLMDQVRESHEELGERCRVLTEALEALKSASYCYLQCSQLSERDRSECRENLFARIEDARSVLAAAPSEQDYFVVDAYEAAPSVCPTCGSENRAVKLGECVITLDMRHHPDSWHSVPSEETTP